MEHEYLLPSRQEPASAPVLIQINPVQILPSYLFRINFNIILNPSVYPT
jgi:hypothetical protein